MRRTGCVVPHVTLLLEAVHTGVISPNTKIDIPNELEDQIEGAEILSMEDEADQLELAFVPEKLQEIKAIAIKEIAKKSTNGRQTALDVQLLNDFFDNSIAMLAKMFPDQFGDERQSPGDEISESAEDFVRMIRGQRKKLDPESVQEFVSNLRKPPVVSRDEARRERLRARKILEAESQNWKLPADTNEFVSRLRRG